MRRHVRTSLFGVASLLLLGACTGSEAPQAAPSPTAQVTAPIPATAPSPVPEPTAVPTNQPTATPTPAPDPMVVPEDLSEIDVEYMQAVVDVFAHNEGEIVREAVEHGEITPRMIELMDRAYGDDLRDLTVRGWSEDFSAGSPPASSPAAVNVDWQVERTYMDVEGCVGLQVTASRSDDSGDEQDFFMALRPRSSDSWLPWRLDRVARYTGTEAPGNPCEA